eukprot:GCRY01007886.1.p1 GENE.GCRY01007886.1~~GCRY01007886.1.p1  ORF type:complete len:116 (+),score=7.34 GCRY01007886.1:128-475(+)
MKKYLISNGFVPVSLSRMGEETTLLKYREYRERSKCQVRKKKQEGKQLQNWVHKRSVNLLFQQKNKRRNKQTNIQWKKGKNNTTKVGKTKHKRQKCLEKVSQKQTGHRKRTKMAV